MYWITVVAELLKVDTDLATKIVDEMECSDFDFSEASDSKIKKTAKLIMKEIL